VALGRVVVDRGDERGEARLGLAVVGGARVAHERRQREDEPVAQAAVAGAPVRAPEHGRRCGRERRWRAQHGHGDGARIDRASGGVEAGAPGCRPSVHPQARRTPTDDPDVALRLIPTTEAAPAERTARALDDELLARARAALDRRDLDAYAACAGETAKLDDPQRRYVARRTLVELGLEARPGDHGPAAAATLLATAGVALEVLETAPAEPVLLNLAGVALFELGALRGADALFVAAKRLDPALPHLEQNRRALKKRRKAGVTVQTPATVRTALPALERRAKAVAAAARPGEPGSISLCMIVRDEERVLDRCLASAAGAVDEIVVVDTGSTDRTVEIARAHGARVLEHAWDDDFSAARNVGLDAATGDWILHLDADEVLADGAAARLRELTRRSWREGFLLTLHHGLGDDHADAAVNDALRLFRNDAAYRFEGRVHETVLGRLPAGAPERIERAGVRVDHDGYTAAIRDAKDKGRRNLDLLERQLREEAPTAYLHFNLGTEYGAEGDRRRAAEHFAKAWTMLLADARADAQPFAPALAARYAGVLRATGRAPEAAAVVEDGLKLFPDFTDLVLEQATLARERGDLAEAERLLRRCLELGDAPARLVHRTAAGTFLAATDLGRVLLAAGDARGAEALLLETLAAHPAHHGGVDALAAAMLARGASAGDVEAAVEARVGTPPPALRFTLAGVLHGAGLAADAEAQLRAALAAAPEMDDARLALAEALVAQRRYAEAADAAAGVAEDSPWAAKAATAHAFAAIAAGDAELAGAALQRAERAGTPAHQRAVLAAWAGTATDRPVPHAGLPLLRRALDTMLRVQDVDAFVRLLPVADRVEGLAARERRELLAGLYLHRGFLDSAADEWAAACEEDGPDSRALTGLARVAAARGDADGARLFAEAALELDPSATAAERLLAALDG
jgi:hypothetical protein